MTNLCFSLKQLAGWLFICFMFLPGWLSAQTHEKSYDQFLLQYEQGKYGEMILSVQKLMERIPDNPVCHFFIAVAYDKQLDGLPMFNSADMEKKIAESFSYYNKAKETLGGPEFKAAEPHIGKIIGDKPSKKNVDSYIEARQGAIKKYFDTLKGFMDKLAVVEKTYKECEEMTTPIAMAYSTPALLYLNINDKHWEAIGKIDEKFTPIKGQIEAIIAEERAAELKPGQLQELQVVPLNEDGRNLTKTWDGDFKRSKIVMYDMQAWANNTRAKAKGVRDLRNRMLELEKEIAQVSEKSLTGSEMKALDAKVASWHKEMEVYDKKYYLYLITNYLLAKARFQNATHEIEQKMKQGLVHREAMEPMVVNLYALLDSASNRLAYVQHDSLYYLNQLPVYERYGRAKGLKEYRENEDKWMTGQHDYWGDVNFYAPSIISSIPDQITRDGKRILIRPVKFDVPKEFDNGALIAERIMSGDDGSTLVIGRHKAGSKGKQPFIMRFSGGPDVKWIRTFSPDSLDAARIADPHTSEAGITALTFAFTRNGKEEYRIEGIAPNGDRILWKEDLDLPVSSHFVHEPEGIFLYEMHKDGAKTIITIEGFGFAGEPGIRSSFALYGEVAKIQVQTGQLLLVANCTSLVGDGLNFTSQAGKGMNVVFLAFKLDGTPPVLTPILSPTPIGAEMLIPTKGTGFILKGQQGSFRITDGGRLVEGQPWEYEYKQKK